MLGWTLFTLLVMVVLTALTLAWWRIGDRWADAEHKRFSPKDVDQPHATVIPSDRRDDARRAGPDG